MSHWHKPLMIEIYSLVTFYLYAKWDYIENNKYM